MNSSTFFQILQVALGNRAVIDAPLTEEQWNDMLQIAKKQALIGLFFNAAMSLPADLQIPKRPKIRAALLAEKIAAKNAALNAHVREISLQMKDLGMRSCLLKGQGVAQLYPKPESRQCGDIDLWVEGDTSSILSRVSSRWSTGHVWYHHVDVRAFEDKTDLEVHFRPIWMNSPKYNRRLQAYFAQVQEEQFSNYNDELGCCVPTSDFNLVFSMIHIYRHLLFEGIGMRQVVDYYYILRNSSSEDRAEAMKQLERFGLGKFVPSVMYVLHEYLGLDRQYLMTEPDAKGGEFLICEIEQAGNFGRLDQRNKYKAGQNMLQKAYHRLEHLMRFAGYASSEVFWAPYFKIRQRIWKRINHYK